MTVHLYMRWATRFCPISSSQRWLGALVQVIGCTNLCPWPRTGRKASRLEPRACCAIVPRNCSSLAERVSPKLRFCRTSLCDAGVRKRQRWRHHKPQQRQSNIQHSLDHTLEPVVDYQPQ